MMRLPHERLRSKPAIERRCIVADSGTLVPIVNRDAMSALADDIEKYYIPRPRFEDGEPVQFGKEFVDCNGHNQTLSSLTYTKGSHDYVSLNGWTKQRIDGSIKRPEPKVLDADGVEIKVGDTVWHKEMGIKFLVTKLPTPDYYSSVEVKTTEPPIYTTGYDPNLLTHREPDSLEKLRDDMKRNIDNMRLPSATYCEAYNRITAIMERDA